MQVRPTREGMSARVALFYVIRSLIGQREEKGKGGEEESSCRQETSGIPAVYGSPAPSESTPAMSSLELQLVQMVGIALLACSPQPEHAFSSLPSWHVLTGEGYVLTSRTGEKTSMNYQVNFVQFVCFLVVPIRAEWTATGSACSQNAL